MFTRMIMIAGVILVAGALAIGALVSGGENRRAQTARPPESAIDEAAQASESEAGPAPNRDATAGTPTVRTDAAPEATPRRARQSRTPAVPSEGHADFSGLWRVLDTVTQGFGTGDSFAFDVVLEQNGAFVTGGTDGIQMTGRVDGQTATLTYRQPELGYTATFTLTLVDGMWGGGTFSSAVNAGTTTLHRLP